MQDNTTLNNAINLLTTAGIRLSHQRMAILQYLLNHRTHPTVADIYDHLHPNHPTLSRTTVYNTLKILVESGAVLQLDIDPECTHYDADLSPHAHFMCRHCGKLYDVPFPSHHIEAPEGFTTDRITISYHGLCPTCASSEKTNN
ncbi:MAG: transcriptional repressor [Paramuribaculum sp.]|nr:transcriptional repressor [Paramuribaculum sp.]